MAVRSFSLVVFVLFGCAERDVPIERRSENIELPAEPRELATRPRPPSSMPTPTPASAPCTAVLPADAFGRGRDAVECGREPVGREGNCSVYDDGLTACYRDGVVRRIRLRPCRLSSDHALDDLRGAGFDVANAEVADTREGSAVVGVPGVWIEGRGGYCYVNP